MNGEELRADLDDIRQQLVAVRKAIEQQTTVGAAAAILTSIDALAVTTGRTQMRDEAMRVIVRAAFGLAGADLVDELIGYWRGDGL